MDDNEPLTVGTITTDRILFAMVEAAEEYEADAEHYGEEEARQLKKEMEFVDGGVVCPLKGTNDGLANGGLEKTLREDFFDAEKAKKILCDLNAVFYGQVNTAEKTKLFTDAIEVDVLESESKPESIKMSLKKPTIIGKPSADGIAATVDIGKTKSAFILKAPRRPEEPELLTHELFVGLKLNELRPILPNFAYVYGGFKCSPPVVTKGKVVSSWCDSSDNAVRYVLYENISPGKDFSDFCEDCTANEYLTVFVESLLAAQIGADLVGFTHNDAHAENVFVREYGEKIYIPYNTPKGTVYVHTDKIATFIDFGRSTIAVDGESYGDYAQFSQGHSDVRAPFPMNDAYKLMMFSFLVLLEKNRTVFQEVSKIFEFFNNEEEIMEALAKQREFFYVLPYTLDELKELTLYDFVDYITYIFPEYNLLLTEDDFKSDDDVYACYGKSTKGVCRTRVKAGPLTPIDYNTPDNIMQLYNLLPYLPADRVQALKREFTEKGTEIALAAGEGRKDLATIFSSYLNEIDTLYEKIVLFDKDEADSFIERLNEMPNLSPKAALKLTEEYAGLAEDYLDAVSLFQRAYYIAGMQDYFVSFFMPEQVGRSKKFVDDIYLKLWADPMKQFASTLAVADGATFHYVRNVERVAEIEAESFRISITRKVINSFVGDS